MKFSKIEIGRQGNFIFALLMIHFVFFGYLSNVYPLKVSPFDIGDGLIFLYQVLYNPTSFISAIILFVIVFFMVFREQFFEYGIRNSIWLIPFILAEAFLWYWFLYPTQVYMLGVFFITPEGYLTILSLLGNVLIPAILAAIIKERYKRYKESIMKIE
jgi:hypothetical protein